MDPLPRRGGHERQRSLDAVLRWSLDRLPSQLHDSLLVLTVFPGRFSPAMARSVLLAVPRCDASAIRTLARGSLVDLDGDDYRLLFTIRDAARRLLAQDPGLHREALDALVVWTTAYGAEKWQLQGYHEDLPPDTVLAIEAGMLHALDTGTPGLGKTWRLMNTITDSRGASAALTAMADRALEVRPHDPDSVLVLAAADSISLFHGSGRRPSGDQIAAVIAVGRAAGDTKVLERALFAAADHEEATGNLEAAMAHRREILALSESTPELSDTVAAALNNVANTYASAGDDASAVEYYQRAAAASRKPGFRTSHAIAHLNLAEVALRGDRPEDARVHALTALKTAPPGWRLRSHAMAYLARAYLRLGDGDSALAAGRDALPDLRKLAGRSQQNAEDLTRLLEEVPGAATASRCPRRLPRTGRVRSTEGMSTTTPPLPSGRVTFVFTDVVGSTRTFIEHGQVFVEALTVLQRATADHARRGNGVVVATEGDGAFLAFPDALCGRGSDRPAGGARHVDHAGSATADPGRRAHRRCGPRGRRLPGAAGQCRGAGRRRCQRWPAWSPTRWSKSWWRRDRRGSEPPWTWGSYSLKDIPDPVRLWRLAGESAPPRATPARRTNVRQSRTSFVGRDRDIDDLRALVETPGLVTAVGPGGVGKTRSSASSPCARRRPLPAAHGWSSWPRSIHLIRSSAPWARRSVSRRAKPWRS